MSTFHSTTKKLFILPHRCFLPIVISFTLFAWRVVAEYNKILQSLLSLPSWKWARSSICHIYLDYTNLLERDQIYLSFPKNQHHLSSFPSRRRVYLTRQCEFQDEMKFQIFLMKIKLTFFPPETTFIPPGDYIVWERILKVKVSSFALWFWKVCEEEKLFLPDLFSRVSFKIMPRMTKKEGEKFKAVSSSINLLIFFFSVSFNLNKLGKEWKSFFYAYGSLFGYKWVKGECFNSLLLFMKNIF